MRGPLVACLLLAAGCVQPAALDPTASGAIASTFRDPILEEHDHASFADHALSTASMSLVGHTPMGEEGKPYSYIGEMDTFGNLTVVQVLGRGSMPGFVVLDVSDPAKPTPIGRAQMPWSYVVDVKWSPDGTRVFAASQSSTGALNGKTPATDDPFAALISGVGFTEWDLSDPAQPKAIAGAFVPPGGCHMLSVKDIGGERFVFCISDVVKVYAFGGGGAWVETSVLVPELGGLSRVVDEALAAGPSAPFVAKLGTSPHDITIQEDPMEPGRVVASVSYWDLGVVWYDVTDPRAPSTLGSWRGAEAGVYEGNVHGAMLYGHHGEERLAVVGPELLGSTVPALWVLDVSDFAAPKLVGEWVPPGEHPTHGLLLTTHQFQVVDDKIYLAYNHAGLWVLSLDALMEGDYASDTTRPEVLGYYLPHEEVELFDPKIAAVPNTWDVNVKDGRILASDRYTGFYVLQYEGDTPGDAALTSAT